MPTRSRVLRFALPALVVAAQWAVATVSAASIPTDAQPQRIVQAAGLVPVKNRDVLAQRALTRSSTWQSFQSRFGDWKAMWNEATGTPHRAFGPSIPLAGFANDPAGAERAARTFIAGHPELFGGPGVELRSVSSSLHGRVWYVRFQQTVHGLPVMFSDWEFRVGTNGRLMMFGADPRSVPADLDARPRIPAPVAREAAHQGLEFNPAIDRVDVAGQLAYVPLVLPDGTPDLRLAYDATVRPARPGSGQRVFVDAGNGTTLWRQPMRADAVTGTVTAQIHPSTPTDALVTRPLRYINVNAVTGSTVTAKTDTTGHYSITPTSSPCTITNAFVGPYCTVVRFDVPQNSAFSRASVTDGSVVNIAWTTLNSQDSERDAFYHTNLAHDWVKEIDEGFTAMDYSLTVNVNWNDGTDCEAYWDQLTNSLNFWLDGTCPNTATIPDLVWHEYAHMVNYQLYYAHGASLGIENLALREGLADAATVLMGADPLVGNGFEGPGTYIRDVRFPSHYPESISPDAHNSGLILSGSMWDFRTATTFAPVLARTLMQLAKYGLPDDIDDGVAMSEFFLDMLIADDNDSDLGNGTPNMGQLNAAFSSHGIGMNYFLGLVHQPLPDQPSLGPYPIHATITYGGPIGGLGTARLFYSASGTPWLSKPMLPTGNPDEFGADIPKYYGIIRYYVLAMDSYGGTRVLPAGAPSRATYQFFAGPVTTLSTDNMETSDGWTVGYASDIPVAVSGTWTRGVPVPSLAQPGVNHTPAGTQCWFTGNALLDDPPGYNDVDDGKTTLVTTTFNATPGGIVYPVVSYWRWYSNDVGDSPNEDPWRVYISNNNGSTWARVENTAASTEGWERKMFAIADYLTPTSTMKMRFVANDTISPSIVEAAVDDWALMGLSSTLDVGGPRAPAEFMLQPAWPNPAQGNAHFRFTLPTAGRVELRVYDLEGRAVRTLIEGDRPPGSHAVSWDGRDDSGHQVASGPYFVRLTREKQIVSRAVVMLR